MKIIMLSTQQESATGTVYQQGVEYELSLADAQSFISKGWAKQGEPSHKGALENYPGGGYQPSDPNAKGFQAGRGPSTEPHAFRYQGDGPSTAQVDTRPPGQDSLRSENLPFAESAAEQYHRGPAMRVDPPLEPGQITPDGTPVVVPGTPFMDAGHQAFPMLLSDTTSSRPDIMVHNEMEYEKAQADGYLVQVPSPGRDNYLKPVVSVPPVIGTSIVPHALRSKADLSKPLSTQAPRNMNAKEAADAGYPVGSYRGERSYEEGEAGQPYENPPAAGYPSAPYGGPPATYPQKSVVIRGSRKPFGTFGAQTVLIKHHESVVDILKFLNQPTDGSVELLRPDTQVPFALEDFPYAYIFHNETLELMNHNLRPAVAVR